MNKLDLQLFFTPGTDPGSYEVNPVNVTTQSSMSPTMKTFYDTTLLENAREQMVFTQLGRKQAMHGKTVEWRKFDTFPKATTPLTEGVIPTGQNFGMTSISVSTKQYGDYVSVSDRLELESYDDVIFGATEEMGAAEGETYDILTRDVISACTNVSYCPKIVGGVETPCTETTDLDATAILTPKVVAQTYTKLKKLKAPLFDGQTYVAVIHPSQAYDLRQTDEWKEFHKYADVAPIFNGEIGTLHGVRFIVSNNVIVEKASESAPATYDALFMGKDAFGVLDPQGEGMEMIIKDRHEAGGPLDQFSTIGYKFCHAAKILYPERIVRVESGSSYSAEDTANTTSGWTK